MMTIHLVTLPILIPLAGAAVAVLLRSQRRLQAGWAFGSMVVSLAVSLRLLALVWRSGQALVFQSGGWPAPFGISLVGDLLALFFVVMSQLVLATGILYALGARDRVVQYPVFYPLFLTLSAGLTGAFLAGDLFNLFVFAELLVISGAALTASSDNKEGPEAAYKYFYISLLASFFLLVAVGAFYVAYGALNLAALAQGIAADPGHPLAALALVMLVAAFAIKSALVPFHFWQPDFHTAAPTAASAMLSSVVVKLGIYGLIRMTTLLFISQAAGIERLLTVLGLAGLFFGGLAAVGASNVKRMLAYSTMGQVGFILLALSWGTPAGLAAALVFAFNHSLIKAAMLMLAGAVASRAPVKSADFSALQGLGKDFPWIGALFLLGGLALAGIPPLNGFISKLLFFQSGVWAGQYAVLLAAASASLLSLVYVGRAFQHIWQAPAEPGVKAKPAGDRLLAPILLLGLVLLLGLWAEPLAALANAAAASAGDPEAYIQAVLGSGLVLR